MYYMKVANRHNDFTSGFEIRAYESRADRQKALDYLWENGSNGMFCSRTEVEQNYGKDFDVYKDDEHGQLYTHLDPFCKGIVDTEFYKNERSYSFDDRKWPFISKLKNENKEIHLAATIQRSRRAAVN